MTRQGRAAPHQWHAPNQHDLALCEQAFAWFLQVCVCDRPPQWHAQVACIAAGFARPCSPVGADTWQLLLAAKYLLFFESLDDAPVEDIAAVAACLRDGRAG